MWYRSKVISGYGRGKLLGYPTLNLVIPDQLNVRHGIYAGYTKVGQKTYKGAFHFGPIPTFKDDIPSLEVFVLDTSFGTKPTKIKFKLVKHLRPIKAFSSQEDLITQITKDVKQTNQLLSQEETT